MIACGLPSSASRTNAAGVGDCSVIGPLTHGRVEEHALRTIEKTATQPARDSRLAGPRMTNRIIHSP